MSKLLNNKKEAIITYGSDFNGCLKLEYIKQHFDRWFFNKKHRYEIIISKEEPHEEHKDKDGKVVEKACSRTHFHVWIKSDKNLNVTTRAWDVSLFHTLWVQGDFDEENPHSGYFNSEEELIEKLGKNVGCKKIHTAHPNVKGKIFGHSIYMIDYVTKQNGEMWSNCNIDELKEKYRAEFEDNFKKKVMKSSKITEIEWEFTTWLRDKIILENLTQSEILDEIHKSKYHKVFYSKYNNYRNLIQDFFKCQPSKKPTPYWGKYYLPKKLYDYCMYLDKFVESWHTGKETEKRPKPLFLSGKAKSCKTSLMVCFGDFCYWCNTWNYNNYEAKTSFNLMDDYDGNVDFKGNGTNNWFAYLKPWFGGQEVINISGKWKNGKIVSNGRPLVFISNYSFENRFPEIEDRKYIIDCDCTIVDLGEHRLCDPEKDWIEGHNDYIEFDTRDTWWYKNKVLEKVSTEVEPPSERECDTNQDNEVVLIDNNEENEEYLPRPKRRKTNE